MAKRKNGSKVQKRGKLRRGNSAKRGKARKVVKSAKATKRAVAKAKPKPAPVKKAARKVKQPVAPVVETVAAEVIEQTTPGVIAVTEVEGTLSLKWISNRPFTALFFRRAIGYRSLPMAFERYIFIIAVTLVRPEEDGDVHLVLRDKGLHMIAEAPSVGCFTGATAARRAQMRTARLAVRLCARAQMTGVAFFDFKHGQTGVAPNAVELHPILCFPQPHRLSPHR